MNPHRTRWDLDAYNGPPYGIGWEMGQYNKYPSQPVDPGTWVTRDGWRLRIAEMNNDHIRNALRLLSRRGIRLHTGLLHHYKLRFGHDFEPNT